MALTFSKKVSGGNLPPSGSIRFYVANSGPWTVDDSTKASIVVTAAEAALLRGHFWLVES